MMKNKKKLKLKRFHFHPVTAFILMTVAVIILSGIFSVLEIQATYSNLNLATYEIENTLVTVKNLFNYDGLKYVISNAARNFISFTTLSTLLISLIGLYIFYFAGLNVQYPLIVALAIGFVDALPIFRFRNCNATMGSNLCMYR